MIFSNQTQVQQSPTIYGKARHRLKRQMLCYARQLNSLLSQMSDTISTKLSSYQPAWMPSKIKLSCSKRTYHQQLRWKNNVFLMSNLKPLGLWGNGMASKGKENEKKMKMTLFINDKKIGGRTGSIGGTPPWEMSRLNPGLPNIKCQTQKPAKGTELEQQIAWSLFIIRGNCAKISLQDSNTVLASGLKRARWTELLESRRRNHNTDFCHQEKGIAIVDLICGMSAERQDTAVSLHSATGQKNKIYFNININNNNNNKT